MDVLARCFKKVAAQVCTKVYNNVICIKEEGNWDVMSCLQIIFFVPDYFTHDHLLFCY
jgi:hypothetical protein